MSAPGSMFFAVIFAATVGFLVGSEHGQNQAKEVARKMVSLSHLTPQCEQMLRDGADAYNAAGDVEIERD